MNDPMPTLTKAETQQWRSTLLGGDDSDELMAWYHCIIPHLRRDASIVEVGVAWGRSLLFAAELMAAHGQIGTIYGVDPYRGPDHADEQGRSAMHWPLAVAGLLRVGHGLELDRMRLVMLPSPQAARALGWQRHDLVMIDGDHRAAAVQEDILHWQQSVRPGGILSGHDYGHPEYPGVALAVDQLLPERKLVGSIWWVRG